jgi:glycosyltransferase involved in cell wall biosynthesis
MRPAGRILFVTEKFPHPKDDGGQIRSFHVLAALAGAFRVTLLSHAAPTAADEDAIRSLGVEVETFGAKRPAWTTPWFAAQALVTREPYPMRKNFSRPILEAIRAAVAAGDVRAVHLNHLDAAQYVEHLGEARAKVRTVFDTHNLLARMYERFAATAGNPLRRGYTTIQWWRMARFEPAILRAVDKVLVCSDLERELVHVAGAGNAMVVPNGVDVGAHARIPRTASDRPTILFTGGLAYPPNAEGVRWFVAEVLPELRRILPRFRFVVVGKGAPASLSALAVPGEVELAGWVEDVRTELARADVSVAPLRVGGGTRIKILESMAAGVPVVATRVGAEGIDAKDGASIVLADEPAAMARSIADLVGDPARARRIGEAARELVAERYDWPRVLEPLVEEYRSISAS